MNNKAIAKLLRKAIKDSTEACDIWEEFINGETLKEKVEALADILEVGDEHTNT